MKPPSRKSVWKYNRYFGTVALARKSCEAMLKDPLCTDRTRAEAARTIHKLNELRETLGTRRDQEK